MTNQYIGIGIVHCCNTADSNGFRTVFTSDNEQWTKNIDDTGTIFNYIQPKQSDMIIRMIKFVCDGWFMCSMKPLAGREGEYRASWIFFPVSLDINADAIENIVNSVEAEIQSNNYNEEKLLEIANQPFNPCQAIVSYVIPRDRSGYAIRYVDDGAHEPLSMIYERIYQSSFVKFDWVILTPEQSVYIKSGANLPDITNELHESWIVSFKMNEDGFVPFYENKSVDGKAFRLTDADNIYIVWYKNNYEPIPKNGNKDEDFEINRREYIKIFNKKSIRIIDEETKDSIPGYAYISANKGREDRNGNISIKEEEWNDTTITVNHSGYEPATIKMSDLERNNFYIRLIPQKHQYSFLIPLKSGYGPLKTEMLTTQNELRECPIEGYKCCQRIHEGENGLVYADSGRKTPSAYPDGGHWKEATDKGGKGVGITNRSWKDIIICGILLLVVGGLIGFFLGRNSITENDSPKKNEDPSSHDVPTDKSTEKAAIVYLDSCSSSGSTRWKKAEMDKYAKLKGLYDLINKKQFDSITIFINRFPDLKQDNNLNRLYEKASKIKKNKNGQYSKDGTITIEEYLVSVQKEIDAHKGNRNTGSDKSDSKETDGATVTPNPAQSKKVGTSNRTSTPRRNSTLRGSQKTVNTNSKVTTQGDNV